LENDSFRGKSFAPFFLRVIREIRGQLFSFCFFSAILASLRFNPAFILSFLHSLHSS
jgi:hypothetical protein